MKERITERFEPAMRDLDITNRVGMLILALATIAGVVVCALLAWPFLGALTWALALAIVFAPLHASMEARLKYRNLAAVVSVSIIALVIALPAAFVAESLSLEASSGAASVLAWVKSGGPETWVKRLLDLHPTIAPIGDWIQQQIDLPTMIATVATWVSNRAASFAQGSVLQLIEIALAFYLLFYFLRDRRAAKRLLQEWLPLTNAESEHLFARVVDTVRATVYGTLAVAAVQGLLGGLMFWFLGLPMPVVWGLAMGLLSVVPVLGAFVVWIPAAAYLALSGSWGKAVILTVWGTVIVGGIDNLLYPMFVGNRLSLHTVPAFISIIGGLALFGAPGLILGPLVVTITILLLATWKVATPFKSSIVPSDRHRRGRN